MTAVAVHVCCTKFAKQSTKNLQFSRYGELRTAPFTVVVTSTSPRPPQDTALDAFILGYSNVTKHTKKEGEEANRPKGENVTHSAPSFIFPSNSVLESPASADANESAEAEQSLEDAILFAETGISKAAREEYQKKFFVLKVSC